MVLVCLILTEFFNNNRKSACKIFLRRTSITASFQVVENEYIPTIGFNKQKTSVLNFIIRYNMENDSNYFPDERKIKRNMNAHLYDVFKKLITDRCQLLIIKSLLPDRPEIAKVRYYISDNDGLGRRYTVFIYKPTFRMNFLPIGK